VNIWFPACSFSIIVVQVFSSWMHFCAVRVFVESILRYGLPPSFLVNLFQFFMTFDFHIKMSDLNMCLLSYISLRF
jgi:hypothetical protein